MLDANIRRRRLGGSVIAGVLNLDPQTDPWVIWARMMGLAPPMEPTIRMAMGKRAERLIVDYYAEITRRKVRWSDETIADPTREYMCATPDGFVEDDSRGVDAKLVAWDQRHLWGDDIDSIPLRPYLQAVWYMAAFDRDVWDVAAMIGGFVEPTIYSIRRDRELEGRVLQDAERWWTDHILNEKPPDLGASPEAARYLQAMYPRNTAACRLATVDETHQLDALNVVRHLQKLLEGGRDLLENRLKAALKHHDGMEWPRGKFTWKRIKDTRKVDWEELATGLLDQLPADTRAQLLQQHTLDIPGYRKVHFHADAPSDAVLRMAFELILRGELPSCLAN